MDFYSIHIVSHRLSSNGGFQSHGSTPWHHPVVMNEPANWFPRRTHLAQEIMAGKSGMAGANVTLHVVSGATWGPWSRKMGSTSGNCVKLPLLEIWKITRQRCSFNTSSQAAQRHNTKTWRPNIKVLLCTTQLSPSRTEIQGLTSNYPVADLNPP